MRAGLLRRSQWSAFLGVLALLVNALVPVHIAFDLADALPSAPRHATHSDSRGAEWSLLARLAGHNEADNKSGEKKDSHPLACPVCSALGTLAGFAAPVAIVVPMPTPAAVPSVIAAIDGEAGTPPLAYHSRAPPTA